MPLYNLRKRQKIDYEEPKKVDSNKELVKDELKKGDSNKELKKVEPIKDKDYSEDSEEFSDVEENSEEDPDVIEDDLSESTESSENSNSNSKHTIMNNLFIRKVFNKVYAKFNKNVQKKMPKKEFEKIFLKSLRNYVRNNPHIIKNKKIKNLIEDLVDVKVKDDDDVEVKDDDDVKDDEFEDEVEDSEDDSIGGDTIENEEDESDYEEWKQDLTTTEIEKFEPVFRSIEKQLEDERPTIGKILKTSLSLNDKIKCIKHCYYLETLEEFGPEYNDVVMKINEIIQNSCINVDEKNEEEYYRKNFFDTETLKNKILKLEASEEIKSILFKKYFYLETGEQTSDTYKATKSQIECALQLPFDKISIPIEYRMMAKGQFFKNVKDKLDSKIYGMDNVKTQLLMLLNNSLEFNNAPKCIGLCGAPGVGKTSMVKAFAESIGSSFEQISLGGARDSTLLLGSDNVYVGSTPGLIVKALQKMKCSNGVILFDEVDKISESNDGKEIQYALLHITDYVQNKHFRDKHIPDIPIDISRLWFFFSMNSTSLIDKALLSRMPIINVDDYKTGEKFEILRNYVIPEILKSSNMNENDIVFTKESIDYLLSDEALGIDKGIRQMRDNVYNIISKIKFYLEMEHSGVNIKLNYKINNLSLPIKIDRNLIEQLINVKKMGNLSYFN
jgi:hypothetical protein